MYKLRSIYIKLAEKLSKVDIYLKLNLGFMLLSIFFNMLHIFYPNSLFSIIGFGSIVLQYICIYIQLKLYSFNKFILTNSIGLDFISSSTISIFSDDVFNKYKQKSI